MKPIRVVLCFGTLNTQKFAGQPIGDNPKNCFLLIFQHYVLVLHDVGTFVQSVLLVLLAYQFVCLLFGRIICVVHLLQ